MRIVPLDKAKPGDVLGRNVVDEAGQVLLYAGVPLKEEYIRLLAAKGFGRLFIRDLNDTLEVEIEEDLPPGLRTKALRTVANVYRAIDKELQSLKKTSTVDIRAAITSDAFKSILSEDGPLASIQDVVSEILDEVLTHATLAGLTSMKCTDAALYQHSIDVCVVGITIASTLNQPAMRLRQLATGSLLHDIGMIFLEKNLPEADRIRQHTLLGFELLRSSEGRDILAPHVAYEHHEHQDGTGLPRGIVGSNLIGRKETYETPVPTLIGEIAAVANAYDVLLTGTETVRPMTPDQAISMIRDKAGTVFNREVVRRFLRVAPVFPCGTEIIVTEGAYKNFTGVVTRVNSAHLDRPVVALCRERHGIPIAPVEIDLWAHSRIKIRGHWSQ